MRHWGLLIFALGLSFRVWAFDNEQIYTGDQLQPVSLAQALGQVSPGTVVIVSEQHDHLPHHRHQVAVLKELRMTVPVVSVGMEFFEYTKQPVIDEFMAGKLSESDFLTQVGWGGNNWPNYREQVLEPLLSGGTTIALNSPRALTSKVAKSGVESLSQEEASLLPPNWSLGNDLYFERFKAVMGGGHIPEQAILRYFTAQSIWDETMSWRAVEFLRKNPSHVLVIIVGDFHAQYGGGLPDKLRQRGLNKIVTISQVNLTDLTPEEQAAEMEPHPSYGPRADFIWVGDR